MHHSAPLGRVKIKDRLPTCPQYNTFSELCVYGCTQAFWGFSPEFWLVQRDFCAGINKNEKKGPNPFASGRLGAMSVHKLHQWHRLCGACWRNTIQIPEIKTTPGGPAQALVEPSVLSLPIDVPAPRMEQDLGRPPGGTRGAHSAASPPRILPSAVRGWKPHERRGNPSGDKHRAAESQRCRLKATGGRREGSS